MKHLTKDEVNCLKTKLAILSKSANLNHNEKILKTGLEKSLNITLDELLEEIQVTELEPDEEARRNVDGWYGVSDASSGGYIAYFSNEEDAFGFRLWLINCRLNGVKSANRY